MGMLKNPTLQQVNAELEKLAASANKGQRSRTATLKITESEWLSPEDCLSAGGEAVANSYSYVAYSTLISVAWYTTGDGVRWVRTYGERIRSPRNAHGRNSRGAFNLTQRQVEKATFQELVFAALAGDHALARETFHFDAGIWIGILADYCEDNGLTWLAEQFRSTIVA